MKNEVTYDDAGDVEVIEGEAREAAGMPPAQGAPADAMGCHSGADMEAAARAAGQSELLDKFRKDYPVGPHDQPQSMCPAFGSLRVGLRMKRVGTVADYNSE